VLFADLKGSMELLADRDPEEARKLLDPVLERMMEAVHHYEGTVNQVMGDGIMALFGAPLAHEDHAVRACYAALRMQERLYWEFTHSHRTQGWLIVESGSVSSGKATAFLPLLDLVRAYLQIEPRDDARRIREKVTSLPALLWLLDAPVDDGDWQRLDPVLRRQQTLDGVKRLLLRESQVQPLVVLFEDLHWIDAETQALLDSLVESLPTARLLLLVDVPRDGHDVRAAEGRAGVSLNPQPKRASPSTSAMAGS
jgi:hypothetical protein